VCEREREIRRGRKRRRRREREGEIKIKRDGERVGGRGRKGERANDKITVID